MGVVPAFAGGAPGKRRFCPISRPAGADACLRRAGDTTLSRALAVVAAAFAVSAVVVFALGRHRGRLPGDAANGRSLHAGVVPRGGGLAIWAGVVPAAIASPPDVPGAWSLWLACTAAVAAVSFADDLRDRPAALRLAVQLAAAATIAMIVVPAEATLRPCWVALVAIAIAWGANLFNFMDGSDGLAASMAIVGFASYAIGAGHADASWAAFASIAAATVPFLAANRPPASMFMGDVGAVPLGFLGAAFGVAGVVQGWWPGWFPPLVFLPFLGDATVTLARRALRGERFWTPHRTHYYQRLVTLGAGHGGTLAAYGTAMLACGAVALALLAHAPDAGWIALACAFVTQLIAFAVIDYHGARTTARAAASPGEPRSERQR